MLKCQSAHQRQERKRTVIWSSFDMCKSQLNEGASYWRNLFPLDCVSQGESQDVMNLWRYKVSWINTPQTSGLAISQCDTFITIQVKKQTLWPQAIMEHRSKGQQEVDLNPKPLSFFFIAREKAHEENSHCQHLRGQCIPLLLFIHEIHLRFCRGISQDYKISALLWLHINEL